MIDRFRDFISRISMRHMPGMKGAEATPSITLVDCGVAYRGNDPRHYSETLDIDGIVYSYNLNLKTGLWNWTCYPPRLNPDDYDLN